MRSCGEISTGARFMRDFVMSHPDYKQDSFLSDEVQYDLMKTLSSLNTPDSEARAQLLKEFA